MSGKANSRRRAQQPPNQPQERGRRRSGSVNHSGRDNRRPGDLLAEYPAPHVAGTYYAHRYSPAETYRAQPNAYPAYSPRGPSPQAPSPVPFSPPGSVSPGPGAAGALPFAPTFFRHMGPSSGRQSAPLPRHSPVPPGTDYWAAGPAEAPNVEGISFRVDLANPPDWVQASSPLTASLAAFCQEALTSRRSTTATGAETPFEWCISEMLESLAEDGTELRAAAISGSCASTLARGEVPDEGADLDILASIQSDGQAPLAQVASIVAALNARFFGGRPVIRMPERLYSDGPNRPEHIAHLRLPVDGAAYPIDLTLLVAGPETNSTRTSSCGADAWVVTVPVPLAAAPAPEFRAHLPAVISTNPALCDAWLRRLILMPSTSELPNPTTVFRLWYLVFKAHGLSDAQSAGSVRNLFRTWVASKTYQQCFGMIRGFSQEHRINALPDMLYVHAMRVGLLDDRPHNDPRNASFTPPAQGGASGFPDEDRPLLASVLLRALTEALERDRCDGFEPERWASALAAVAWPDNHWMRTPRPNHGVWRTIPVGAAAKAIFERAFCPTALSNNSSQLKSDATKLGALAWLIASDLSQLEALAEGTTPLGCLLRHAFGTSTAFAGLGLRRPTQRCGVLEALAAFPTTSPRRDPRTQAFFAQAAATLLNQTLSQDTPEDSAALLPVLTTNLMDGGNWSVALAALAADKKGVESLAQLAAPDGQTHDLVRALLWALAGHPGDHAETLRQTCRTLLEGPHDPARDAETLEALREALPRTRAERQGVLLDELPRPVIVLALKDRTLKRAVIERLAADKLVSALTSDLRLFSALLETDPERLLDRPAVRRAAVDQGELAGTLRTHLSRKDLASRSLRDLCVELAAAKNGNRSLLLESRSDEGEPDPIAFTTACKACLPGFSDIAFLREILEASATLKTEKLIAARQELLAAGVSEVCRRAALCQTPSDVDEMLALLAETMAGRPISDADRARLLLAALQNPAAFIAISEAPTPPWQQVEITPLLSDGVIADPIALAAIHPALLDRVAESAPLLAPRLRDLDAKKVKRITAERLWRRIPALDTWSLAQISGLLEVLEALRPLRHLAAEYEKPLLQVSRACWTMGAEAMEIMKTAVAAHATDQTTAVLLARALRATENVRLPLASVRMHGAFGLAVVTNLQHGCSNTRESNDVRKALQSLRGTLEHNCGKNGWDEASVRLAFAAVARRLPANVALFLLTKSAGGDGPPPEAAFWSELEAFCTPPDTSTRSPLSAELHRAAMSAATTPKAAPWLRGVLSHCLADQAQAQALRGAFSDHVSEAIRSLLPKAPEKKEKQRRSKPKAQRTPVAAAPASSEASTNTESLDLQLETWFLSDEKARAKAPENTVSVLKRMTGPLAATPAGLDLFGFALRFGKKSKVGKAARSALRRTIREGLPVTSNAIRVLALLVDHRLSTGLSEEEQESLRTFFADPALADLLARTEGPPLRTVAEALSTLAPATRAEAAYGVTVLDATTQRYPAGTSREENVSSLVYAGLLLGRNQDQDPYLLDLISKLAAVFRTGNVPAKVGGIIAGRVMWRLASPTGDAEQSAAKLEEVGSVFFEAIFAWMAAIEASGGLDEVAPALQPGMDVALGVLFRNHAAPEASALLRSLDRKVAEAPTAVREAMFRRCRQILLRAQDDTAHYLLGRSLPITSQVVAEAGWQHLSVAEGPATLAPFLNGAAFAVAAAPGAVATACRRLAVLGLQWLGTPTESLGAPIDAQTLNTIVSELWALISALERRKLVDDELSTAFVRTFSSTDGDASPDVPPIRALSRVIQEDDPASALLGKLPLLQHLRKMREAGLGPRSSWEPIARVAPELLADAMAESRFQHGKTRQAFPWTPNLTDAARVLLRTLQGEPPSTTDAGSLFDVIFYAVLECPESEVASFRRSLDELCAIATINAEAIASGRLGGICSRLADALDDFPAKVLEARLPAAWCQFVQAADEAQLELLVKHAPALLMFYLRPASPESGHERLAQFGKIYGVLDRLDSADPRNRTIMSLKSQCLGVVAKVAGPQAAQRLSMGAAGRRTHSSRSRSIRS